MPGSTPAVAVEHASRPGERRLFGTIAHLPEALAAAGLDGRTLVLIEDVVEVSQELAVPPRSAA